LKRAFLIAMLMLLPATASAVEKQHHLGVDVGMAMLGIKQKDGPSVGMGFLAHWAYGLTDQWQVAVEGGYSIVSTGEQKDIMVKQDNQMIKLPNNRPAHVFHGGAGIHYVLDVLRWVPYFGIHATTFGLLGGNLDSPRFAFGMTLAAGIDYQLTRAFTIGFAARQHFPFSALDDYPTFTHFLARAEFVWGW
jgi:hypothetical protein